jgi:type I restriction enzyme S subunit
MKPTDALPHPSDWQESSIGRAIEIKRGVSWSKEDEHSTPRDGAVPVIRIGNVQSTLELNDMLYISNLNPKAVEKKRVGAGWSILVGSNGNRARIGNTVLIREKVNFLFASFLLGARPVKDAGFSSEWFFRWLETERVQAYLTASAEGSTGLSNLSHSFLRSLTIAFPPTDAEQAVITRILDAVDNAIERTGSAVDAARNTKRALMAELCEKGTRGASLKKSVIGWIPTNWEVRTVSSVTSSFQYGLSVPMQRKGSLPILRMGNIQGGDVVFNELKYLDLPAHMTGPYLVQRGDILFNRTNSQELVGKVGIYRRNDGCCFASYLIRVVPDTALVDGYYLGHVLNSYNAQCRIKRYATPGAQQVNINATNLGKVLIPVPVGSKGIEEQREIAQILEAAHVLISSYQPKLSALEQLKKSLMNDLLTGSVRVPVHVANVI